MTCGICDGDSARREFINRNLNASMRPATIEALSKQPSMPLGFVTKAETITKHARNCLGLLPVKRQLVNAEVSTDFAVLVRDEASKRVRSGDEVVTVAHGLKAQQLLDRREERQADRELALGIAKMLNARHPEGVNVIEGSYERLEPTSATDPEVREPAPVINRGNHDTRNLRRLAT